MTYSLSFSPPLSFSQRWLCCPPSPSPWTPLRSQQPPPAKTLSKGCWRRGQRSSRSSCRQRRTISRTCRCAWRRSSSLSNRSRYVKIPHIILSVAHTQYSISPMSFLLSLFSLFLPSSFPGCFYHFALGGVINLMNALAYTKYHCSVNNLL